MNKKIRTAIVAGLTNVALVAISAPAYAAIQDPLGGKTLDQLIANAFVVLFAAVAVIAIGFLVVGGIQYMTSGGDKMGVQAAQGKITGAIIGLIVALGSYLIVNQVVCIGILGKSGGCIQDFGF